MSVHGTGHEEEERTWPLLDRCLGLGRSEGGGKRGGCGFRAAQAGLSLDPRLQASIREMGFQRVGVWAGLSRGAEVAQGADSPELQAPPANCLPNLLCMNESVSNVARLKPASPSSPFSVSKWRPHPQYRTETQVSMYFLSLIPRASLSPSSANLTPKALEPFFPRPPALGPATIASPRNLLHGLLTGARFPVTAWHSLHMPARVS